MSIWFNVGNETTGVAQFGRSRLETSAERPIEVRDVGEPGIVCDCADLAQTIAGIGQEPTSQ